MAGLGPIRRNVTVANPNGLHMRPATQFAIQARTYKSRIRVHNGSNSADGKSPMDMMLLVALPGAELVLEADGVDAESAVEILAELLGSPGDGL
jgi:phosphotransferase system HPr (HPr) family protein